MTYDIALLVTFSYGWVMLSQVVESDDDSSLCSDTRLYHVAAIQTAWSLVFSTCFMCTLVGIVYQRFAFLKPPAKAYGERGEVRWVVARGFWVPTIFYRAPDSARDPFTIIYSHGNGVDLAMSQDLLLQMKTAFKCNVIIPPFVIAWSHTYRIHILIMI
jgi:hypothetical protein